MSMWSTIRIYRVSEAMRIALLYSRLVLSIDGIVARSRQTKPDIGRIVRPAPYSMARAQCEECTRCIHPSRWPRVRNEAICVLEDPPPPPSSTTPTRFQPFLPFSPPFPPSPTFRLRPRGRETATARVRSCVADRDASVPLQVVNETDLSLSLSLDALSAALLLRARSLSPSRIIISRQPKEPRTGGRIAGWKKRKSVSDQRLKMFPGERESA